MFFNASHSLFRRVRHADAVDVDALALLIAHLRWPGPVGAFGAATPALPLVALALLHPLVLEALPRRAPAERGRRRC